jgi:predicted oxidoreductase (fatty acid repression mutant protein)
VGHRQGGAQEDSAAGGLSQSEAKINGSFRAGAGTVLFFEDTAVIEDLQQKFALYADNFPIWSEHATGIAQFAVWTTWPRRASAPPCNTTTRSSTMRCARVGPARQLAASCPDAFGSIEQPAGDKTFIDDDVRFRVFK